jgi:hypothetical protein
MKKEKLTYKNAIQECIRVWDWLYRNPAQMKYNVPFITIYESHCPCCQYVRDTQTQVMLNCRKCPLVDVWNAKSTHTQYCTQINSPYHKWNVAFNSIDRKKYAKIIRDGAISVLKEYYKTEERNASNNVE